MIKSSEAYKQAIIADSRCISLKVSVDITDPDITYGDIVASDQAIISKSEQLYNRVFDVTPFATLEYNRWRLDGSFQMVPTDLQINGEMGFVGDVLSDENGVWQAPVWMMLPLGKVSILQACSVYFSDNELDGIPMDFIVEVLQGGTVYYTQSFADNTERTVKLSGFTVYNPDALRVTVSKWSLPYRRLRVIEMIPGAYEYWTAGDMESFSLKHQGDVSCVSLPYGTCTIRMDNLDRRFEPRNKDGMFLSIEERQEIDVQMGAHLPDGTVEYKRLGMYYQYSGGWQTGDNGLTMQWDLVDIIGLLADREFIPPSTLPTTLSGWIAALVAQLGDNFTDKYTIDPNYADLPVAVVNAEDVTGVNCGDLLRYVCMASGTWPRADAESGYLTAEPLWDEGDKITLDNLTAYPTMKANKDVAAIIFTLNDDNDTKYVVSGNTTASSGTVSVQNPFIQTKEQALQAAKLILAAYGGNQFEITGRGNPASEIGDVDTIWLDESNATTARRIQQNLSISSGVLQGCQSTLLQADGTYLFENRTIITETSAWQAPAGVTQLRVIVVGGGSGGTAGTDGNWSAAGENGVNGSGAKIWTDTISINPQQTFTVTIGQGGSIGLPGQDTVFGAYTSANGQVFEYGYTDIASGESFGRTGVQKPLPNTGDGGIGGAGGAKGNRHTETSEDGSSHTVVDNYPGKGEPGIAGASGCVVIYWEKI